MNRYDSFIAPIKTKNIIYNKSSNFNLKKNYEYFHQNLNGSQNNHTISKPEHDPILPILKKYKNSVKFCFIIRRLLAQMMLNLFLDMLT